MRILRLIVPALAFVVLAACRPQEPEETVPSEKDKPSEPAVDTVSTVDPLPIQENTLYIYTLRKPKGTIAAYDEAMAATTIQGIINRECGPILYIQSQAMGMPQYWLDILSADGWLAGKAQVKLETFDDLMALAINKVNWCVIWDPSVPATVNVATTIAGIRDAVVLSPSMASTYQMKYGLRTAEDLQGKFTGAVTGSKKNDAYRWAAGEYLSKCNPHLACLYEDSWASRKQGNLNYVVTRDWAVYNRSFVLDLSPWDDEKPKDDPTQPIGCDVITYKQILTSLQNLCNGTQMTELAGFFVSKYASSGNDDTFTSKHGDVQTEWQNVKLISPYNCYQNTVAHSCYNQSVHSQAPITLPLKQNDPPVVGTPQPGKTYICIQAGDYDSTTPLYVHLFEKGIWTDSARGRMPLCWGINPNLIETFPDIFDYLYRTRTENDWFAADATGAGYINPTYIRPSQLPLFISHSKKYYEIADMSISSFVLDWTAPTDEVKDAYAQFSPDGYAMYTINNIYPAYEVWKGEMPVTKLWGGGYARMMEEMEPIEPTAPPQYFLCRNVWLTPSAMYGDVNKLIANRPDLDIEVLDPYTFFGYLKQTYK